MEKGPLPAKHTHGPNRQDPTQSSLHHKHGPTPGAQRSINRTTAHQNPSGTDPTTTCNLTIYVDGGWDTVNADFTTAFQEQRDPTNRRGSAGIAIVPTGPDWMNKGTILITLSDGSKIGSQPAHM